MGVLMCNFDFWDERTPKQTSKRLYCVGSIMSSSFTRVLPPARELS